MVVSFRVEHTSELVTARNHNKIMNLQLRDTMERHKNVGLPQRFRQGPKTRPGGEFGFKARTRKYQRRKSKLKGHLKPNVWTGETRTKASLSVVRATAKVARLYFRASFPMTLERRNEFERMSRLEQYKYVKTFKRRYTEMANSKQFKRKRRKRIK
ncbi:hypothetical protein [Gimesia maris]|uniref:hypothetical protein n=1 Tax=Gimesia maris TaxID=122 RepID=UPI0032EF849D